MLLELSQLNAPIALLSCGLVQESKAKSQKQATKHLQMPELRNVSAGREAEGIPEAHRWLHLRGRIVLVGFFASSCGLIWHFVRFSS